MASSGSSIGDITEESQVGEACLAPIRTCIYIYILYIRILACIQYTYIYVYKYVPGCLYSASKYMHVCNY